MESTKKTHTRSEADRHPAAKPELLPSGVAAGGRKFFDDVREWVELRVELFQVDMEDRIQDAVNRMAQAAIVVVLMAVALLFVAMAAAFALGEWIGSTALGFLVVAVIGFLAAVGVKSSRPKVAPRLFSGDSEGSGDQNQSRNGDRSRKELP